LHRDSIRHVLDIHKGYGENSLDGIVDEINRAFAANATETGAFVRCFASV